ncbi:hypothetical protein [Massilia violaceinigra]|uniref:hypothetical protein n=1 Tax=Massilia violaceinigra TaxID=2045208 RepID=UPI0012FD2773|nr:hypothetical protein [Massilia violaceinigra]
MNDVDEIELHDALLKSMETDFLAKTVKITVGYYANPDDSKRKEIVIVFEGVESISQISDLDQLQKNAFAGNVNYWRPNDGGMATYIYLTDGCIAITAKKITLGCSSN